MEGEQPQVDRDGRDGDSKSPTMILIHEVDEKYGCSAYEGCQNN